MNEIIPRRIGRRIDQFARREHQPKQQWMHPGIVVKTCMFRPSDEPAVLAFVRVELALYIGDSVVLDECQVIRSKSHTRLSMPTWVHSSDDSIMLRNITSRTRKGIEAVVLREFELWSREER